MRDISDILREWPYDPDASVRKLVGEEGRELIQVRTPLGIEQYELVGRPDALRPHGFQSALAYADNQREEAIRRTGSADDFRIDSELASELQQEGLIFYYRYLVCFQIGEYDVVVRDTAHNLRMFDLLQAHCDDEEAVSASEQYRPYVMRMNAAARTLLAVGQDDYPLARNIIDKALHRIAALPEVDTQTFDYEKQRSLAILRGMKKAIPEVKPVSEEAELRKELDKVIAEENYERAAQIRDRLRELTFPRDESHTQTSDLKSNDE
ncbi:MAG: UvrB/UvrC motif-containing protein [Planctomycetota bacterium]